MESFFWLLSLFVLIGLTSAQTSSVCNSETVGDSVCVKYDLFDDYQYATCVSASYIEEQSFGFVKCSMMRKKFYLIKC